ncbi:vWA domain-containing protein [Nitratifractor sp.]
MSFAHPIAFALLPLLWICARYCRSALPETPMANLALLRRALGGGRRLEPWLRGGIWLLLVVALADPVERRILQVEEGKGHEILLLLDASYSMREEGRFERAKAILGDFVKRRKGDRMGLLLFADHPYLAVPMTAEKKGLEQILEYLKIGIAGGRDTALYEALYMGAGLFGDSRGKNRIAVLLTDGIDTVGRIPLSAAIARAREAGVRVITIGLGEDYDVGPLRKIARETGGAFYPAPDAAALRKIYDRIDAQTRSRITLRSFTETRHYYRIPLAGALLLLTFLLWMRRRDRSALRRLGAVWLLLLAALYGPSLPAEGEGLRPSPPTLLVALDLSRFMEVKDLYPDRLRFARHKIEGLLDALPEARIGILGYTKIPYLLAPPTADHAALRRMLKRMELRGIDREESDLRAALRGAAKLLKGGSPKLLLLFTPGGEGSAEAERLAREENLSVAVYGTGTSRGGILGSEEDPVTDERGAILVSRLDPDLERLAEETGGIYLKASPDDGDLERLARWVREHAGKNAPLWAASSARRQLYGIPLALAMGLFLLPAGAWRRRRR